jgi:hypothetical protein
LRSWPGAVASVPAPSPLAWVPVRCRLS